MADRLRRRSIAGWSTSHALARRRCPHAASDDRRCLPCPRRTTRHFLHRASPQRSARKARRAWTVLLGVSVRAGLARILDRFGWRFRRKAIQHQGPPMLPSAQAAGAPVAVGLGFVVRLEAMQIEAPVALEPAVIDVYTRNRVPDSQQVRILSDVQRVAAASGKRHTSPFRVHRCVVGAARRRSQTARHRCGGSVSCRSRRRPQNVRSNFNHWNVAAGIPEDAFNKCACGRCDAKASGLHRRESATPSVRASCSQRRARQLRRRHPLHSNAIQIFQGLIKILVPGKRGGF